MAKAAFEFGGTVAAAEFFDPGLRDPAVVGMLQPVRGTVEQFGLAPTERPGPGRIDGVPDAVAIGDTPYDAAAAGKAKIATIGVLCGGFTEDKLRQAGCVDVYPGPAALFSRFAKSILAR